LSFSSSLTIATIANTIGATIPETIDPLYGLLSNWWGRAGLSFIVGLLFALIVHGMDGMSFLIIMFGMIAIVLGIVAPIVFAIVAMVKEEENDNC